MVVLNVVVIIPQEIAIWYTTTWLDACIGRYTLGDASYILNFFLPRTATYALSYNPLRARTHLEALGVQGQL